MMSRDGAADGAATRGADGGSDLASESRAASSPGSFVTGSGSSTVSAGSGSRIQARLSWLASLQRESQAVKDRSNGEKTAVIRNGDGSKTLPTSPEHSNSRGAVISKRWSVSAADPAPPTATQPSTPPRSASVREPPTKSWPKVRDLVKTLELKSEESSDSESPASPQRKSARDSKMSPQRKSAEAGGSALRAFLSSPVRGGSNNPMPSSAYVSPIASPPAQVRTATSPTSTVAKPAAKPARPASMYILPPIAPSPSLSSSISTSISPPRTLKQTSSISSSSSSSTNRLSWIYTSASADKPLNCSTLEYRSMSVAEISRKLEESQKGLSPTLVTTTSHGRPAIAPPNIPLPTQLITKNSSVPIAPRGTYANASEENKKTVHDRQVTPAQRDSEASAASTPSKGIYFEPSFLRGRRMSSTDSNTESSSSSPTPPMSPVDEVPQSVVSQVRKILPRLATKTTEVRSTPVPVVVSNQAAEVRSFAKSGQKPQSPILNMGEANHEEEIVELVSLKDLEAYQEGCMDDSTIRLQPLSSDEESTFAHKGPNAANRLTVNAAMGDADERDIVRSRSNALATVVSDTEISGVSNEKSDDSIFPSGSMDCTIIIANLSQTDSVIDVEDDRNMPASTLGQDMAEILPVSVALAEDNTEFSNDTQVTGTVHDHTSVDASVAEHIEAGKQAMELQPEIILDKSPDVFDAEDDPEQLVTLAELEAMHAEDLRLAANSETLSKRAPFSDSAATDSGMDYAPQPAFLTAIDSVSRDTPDDLDFTNTPAHDTATESNSSNSELEGSSKCDHDVVTDSSQEDHEVVLVSIKDLEALQGENDGEELQDTGSEALLIDHKATKPYESSIDDSVAFPLAIQSYLTSQAEVHVSASLSHSVPTPRFSVLECTGFLIFNELTKPCDAELGVVATLRSHISSEAQKFSLETTGSVVVSIYPQSEQVEDYVVATLRILEVLSYNAVFETFTAIKWDPLLPSENGNISKDFGIAAASDLNMARATDDDREAVAYGSAPITGIYSQSDSKSIDGELSYAVSGIIVRDRIEIGTCLLAKPLATIARALEPSIERTIIDTAPPHFDDAAAIVARVIDEAVDTAFPPTYQGVSHLSSQNFFNEADEVIDVLGLTECFTYIEDFAELFIYAACSFKNSTVELSHITHSIRYNALFENASIALTDHSIPTLRDFDDDSIKTDQYEAVAVRSSSDCTKRATLEAPVCFVGAIISPHRRVTLDFSVCHLSLNKCLSVVYTNDNWKSVKTSASGCLTSKTDRIESITVELDEEVMSTSRIEFAAKLEADGVEYWDNRSGLNHWIEILMPDDRIANSASAHSSVLNTVLVDSFGDVLGVEIEEELLDCAFDGPDLSPAFKIEPGFSNTPEDDGTLLETHKDEVEHQNLIASADECDQEFADGVGGFNKNDEMNSALSGSGRADSSRHDSGIWMSAIRDEISLNSMESIIEEELDKDIESFNADSSNKASLDLLRGLDLEPGSSHGMEDKDSGEMLNLPSLQQAQLPPMMSSMKRVPNAAIRSIPEQIIIVARLICLLAFTAHFGHTTADYARNFGISLIKLMARLDPVFVGNLIVGCIMSMWGLAFLRRIKMFVEGR